jgi:hypothetical protein
MPQLLLLRAVDVVDYCDSASALSNVITFCMWYTEHAWDVAFCSCTRVRCVFAPARGGADLFYFFIFFYIFYSL